VAAVGIGGAGLVAADAGAVAVVAPCAVLDIEGVSAQIVHELAVVVGAEVAGLEGVGIAAAVAANVDGVAGAVVARWPVFDVVVRVVVVVAGDSRWLWLRYRARVAVFCACNVGLLLHLAAIRFGFSDFSWWWRCGGDWRRWRRRKFVNLRCGQRRRERRRGQRWQRWQRRQRRRQRWRRRLRWEWR